MAEDEHGAWPHNIQPRPTQGRHLLSHCFHRFVFVLLLFAFWGTAVNERLKVGFVYAACLLACGVVVLWTRHLNKKEGGERRGMRASKDEMLLRGAASVAELSIRRWDHCFCSLPWSPSPAFFA